MQVVLLEGGAEDGQGGYWHHPPEPLVLVHHVMPFVHEFELDEDVHELLFAIQAPLHQYWPEGHEDDMEL
ncbi:MAG: hypothetical protein WC659_01230 [Patescibacteria group bacterium]